MMIEISALTKIYPSGTKAIDGLSLSIAEGEILGLLGPNGAGKTTTIRVLSTLSGFDEGQVKVAGHDVDTAPDQVRASIGVVAQQTGVDYFLTGRENLVLQGQLYHMPRKAIQARVGELSRYFELDEALDRPVAGYSGGMRRKLDIAAALIHGPRLIFLDEPTLGLDIKSRKSLWTLIERLNRDLGLTILLTTHYLEEADKLAHRVAIINAGKVQTIGTPEELKNSIRGDALFLAFGEEQGEAGAFAERLKGEDYVTDLVWEGRNLRVYVNDGAECVPKVVMAASKAGITLKTLSLSRPTLDDVFLKYTGTSLEGTAEEPQEEWWKQWAGKGGGGNWQKKWGQADTQTDSNADADASKQWPDAQWSETDAPAAGEGSSGQWQDDGQWQRGEWNKEGQWPGSKQDKS